MDIHSIFYRKAFLKYLRKGVPLELTLKEEEKPTKFYIWRTQGDARVRPTHAERDGHIFPYGEWPEPGDEPGCRCWDEPYEGPNDDYEDFPLSEDSLNQEQLVNFNRFLKKFSKSNKAGIFQGNDGQVIFRQDIYARNIPGSFARYEKIIDRFGNTVYYIKKTYSPDGKIVHIKLK